MSKATMILPKISEKSFKQAQSENVYLFEVPRSTNKLQIKEAVEVQYKVTVEDVRTANIQGKPKNSPRRRLQPIKGQRSTTKKAYVKLKEGDRISVFEEEA